MGRGRPRKAAAGPGSYTVRRSPSGSSSSNTPEEKVHVTSSYETGTTRITKFFSPLNRSRPMDETITPSREQGTEKKKVTPIANKIRYSYTDIAELVHKISEEAGTKLGIDYRCTPEVKTGCKLKPIFCELRSLLQDMRQGAPYKYPGYLKTMDQVTKVPTSPTVKSATPYKPSVGL